MYLYCFDFSLSRLASKKKSMLVPVKTGVSERSSKRNVFKVNGLKTLVHCWWEIRGEQAHRMGFSV